MVEDYRGVTIMPSLYKIYAEMLAGRLREELEEKGVLPPNQAGFRKEISTIDNIYVLNYLINRQIGGRGKKVVALFIDLRTAFDSVDRRVLIRAMRKRGIGEGLIERVRELVGKTRSRVRIGGSWGRSSGR